MRNGIHFISGLPRSGSTLLSGLLRQNPRLHAHISSPVAAMFGSLQVALSGRSEYHPLVTEAQRLAVLKGLFENYYAGLHETKTIIDTNRSWTGKLPGLLRLHPDAKVICCVRPIAWIVDSFERLVRESPFEPSRIYNFSPGGNVYTRSDHLNGPKGVIGLAYQCLKDGFFGPHADRLLLVPYDVLTHDPAYVMREIYAFLGLEPFGHDFENVMIEADEFDRRLGTPGLHAVGAAVRPPNRTLSIPPDLAARFAQSQFWADPKRNLRGVRVLGRPAAGMPQERELEVET